MKWPTTFVPIKVLSSLHMNAGTLSLTTTLGTPNQANISFRNLIIENFVMDFVSFMYSTYNLSVQASTVQ